MPLNTHSYELRARLRELERERGVYENKDRRLLGEARRLLHVDRHRNVGGFCGTCANDWPCPIAVWDQAVTGADHGNPH